jgi:hypothetical protein
MKLKELLVESALSIFDIFSKAKNGIIKFRYGDESTRNDAQIDKFKNDFYLNKKILSIVNIPLQRFKIGQLIYVKGLDGWDWYNWGDYAIITDVKIDLKIDDNINVNYMYGLTRIKKNGNEVFTDNEFIKFYKEYELLKVVY